MTTIAVEHLTLKQELNLLFHIKHRRLGLKPVFLEKNSLVFV